MWHDNETTTDLIGFQRLADGIATLSTDGSILPVTIGLFGDWGSGKSSVLAMVERELSQRDGVLVLRFDGWLFEGYDDAKAALMTSILEYLTVRIKEREGLWDKVGGCVKSLLNRVNWFRAAGLAAKGILTLTSPVGAAVFAGLTTADAVSLLAQMAQDPEAFKEIAGSLISDRCEDDSSVSQGMHESIRDFRCEFERLIREAELGTLVVLIDDLDRCLPESIVATLEAIKLFLSVPGTAFVIAADPRIVRQAISRRYPPEAYQEFDIAQEYLDKLVQIPCLIPPMDQAETETYVYLLFAERVLESQALEQLLDRVRGNRNNPSLPEPLNYGIAESCLGDDARQLEADYAVAERISPILARQLGGNPRLVKRFLNTFALRIHLADLANIELEQAVLAKLMVLERFHAGQFEALYKWQAEQDGVPEELPLLEAGAAHPDAGVAGMDEATSALWFGDPDLRAWLQMEPELVGRNLAPYYHLARASLRVKVAGLRRLSQEQQELFAELQSGSKAVQKRAAQRLTGKGDEEIHAVCDALWERGERNPRESRALQGLVEVAYLHAPAARRLLASLHDISPANFDGQLVVRMAGIKQHQPSLETLVDELLSAWAASAHRPVSQAAQRLLEIPGEGTGDGHILIENR